MIISYTGEKMPSLWVCPDCAKKLGFGKNPYDHVRTWDNEPYKCELCGKIIPPRQIHVISEVYPPFIKAHRQPRFLRH